MGGAKLVLGSSGGKGAVYGTCQKRALPDPRARVTRYAASASVSAISRRPMASIPGVAGNLVHVLPPSALRQWVLTSLQLLSSNSPTLALYNRSHSCTWRIRSIVRRMGCNSQDRGRIFRRCRLTWVPIVADVPVVVCVPAVVPVPAVATVPRRHVADPARFGSVIANKDTAVRRPDCVETQSFGPFVCRVVRLPAPVTERIRLGTQRIAATRHPAAQRNQRRYAGDPFPPHRYLVPSGRRKNEAPFGTG
jgi:hypothetical protein